ncbi:splicing factor 3b subunit [Anaeramoeba flamelloides]|uniref:Splicing factor 3b subunit n=1 Tax=Anaeramoeba flamelloides TaxID=1746091 RepID=A0AAV7YK50_9EUKA|nr:splicing factor 3b subunit [Anaeramoeba flamelloides]
MFENDTVLQETLLVQSNKNNITNKKSNWKQQKVTVYQDRIEFILPKKTNVVPLEELEVLVPPLTTFTKDKYILKLSQMGKKPYFLQFPLTQTMKEWKVTLVSAIMDCKRIKMEEQKKIQELQKNTKPDKSGLLQFRTKGKKKFFRPKWKKRYCEFYLSTGILSWYSDAQKKALVGDLDLKGSTEISETKFQDEPFGFTITTDNNILEFATSSNEELSLWIDLFNSVAKNNKQDIKKSENDNKVPELGQDQKKDEKDIKSKNQEINKNPQNVISELNSMLLKQQQNNIGNRNQEIKKKDIEKKDYNVNDLNQKTNVILPKMNSIGSKNKEIEKENESESKKVVENQLEKEIEIVKENENENENDDNNVIKKEKNNDYKQKYEIIDEALVELTNEIEKLNVFQILKLISYEKKLYSQEEESKKKKKKKKPSIEEMIKNAKLENKRYQMKRDVIINSENDGYNASNSQQQTGNVVNIDLDEDFLQKQVTLEPELLDKIQTNFPIIQKTMKSFYKDEIEIDTSSLNSKQTQKEREEKLNSLKAILKNLQSINVNEKIETKKINEKKEIDDLKNFFKVETILVKPMK